MTTRYLDAWQGLADRLSELAGTSPSLISDLCDGADAVIELADAWPDAALAAVLRVDASHYASAHSLHVAILAAMLSGTYGWQPRKRQAVVRAALAMNLAMVELQMILQDQHEPLSETQRRELQTHPQRGYQLLFSLGVADQDWLEAVRLHHEILPLAPDAVRLPDGRTLAQMLRLLDVFCAKISGRSYRRAMLPAQAARELMAQEARRCGPLVEALVATVGLYLPGSWVRLANGEVAMVKARGADLRTPLVAVPPDLPERDTARPEWAVAALLPDEHDCADLGAVWVR